MHLRIVRRVEKERSSDEINQGPCGRGLTTKSELYNKFSRTYKMMCNDYNNDYNDYNDMRPKNVKIQQSPQRSRESELSRHWPLSVFSMSQSKCDNAPTLRYNTTMQQCDNNSTISGSFFPNWSRSNSLNCIHQSFFGVGVIVSPYLVVLVQPVWDHLW